MLRGEHVEHDDNGLDRLSGDPAAFPSEAEFESDRIIRADIAWRGPRLRPAAVKPANVAPARRRPSAGDFNIEDVIVGSSQQAKDLRQAVRLYAESDVPVLIAGETGAGKELVARELHRLSPRRAAPFYALNAGAIPETLATAELFGHSKGAFTGAVAERDGAFAAAEGGALFLDEIGEMPLSIQAQLLRVLDDGMVTRIGSRSGVRVDFRLIAATNVDLSRCVAAGAFRSDLFYRINVLTIHTPPLRERGDDVIEIAEQMIVAHPDPRFRKAKIAPAAADRLRAHRFPGNIRELRNLLYRALVHTNGGKILPEHLGMPPARVNENGAAYGVTEAKELVGRVLMLKALRAAEGNVTKAAETVGRSRGAVHALMKELDGANLATEYENACAKLRALLDD